MVRLFRATHAMATAAGLWVVLVLTPERRKAYAGCSIEERLIGAEREPQGCMLMTLHKSKGKEFDGVVIVEGFRGGGAVAG